MSRTSQVCVILFAIANAAAAPPAAAAGEAGRLAGLGADRTSPRGAMKLFVLALKHNYALRMADLVAPAGKDDEAFIADYDAVTDAITRLRAASVERFGEGPTHKVARGMLREPDDDQLRALFAQMDGLLPGQANGDSVDLGAAASQFYARSAVRRDGKWKIALSPQITTPHVIFAELGDLRAFAAAVGELAEGVAAGRVATSGELEERLTAALRARGESVAAGADLKALQGEWERKPVGDEERAGGNVARVVCTFTSLQHTRTYFDHDGKAVLGPVPSRFVVSRRGDVGVITFSDVGSGKGKWRTHLYAVKGEHFAEVAGLLGNDALNVTAMTWTRVPAKKAQATDR